MSEPFLRMTWADAMKYYGSDKPDLRFGMKFVELMDIMKGHGFSVFDDAAYIGGICAEGAASYTRKQLDQLTEFVKKPQIGAKGMVYARVEADGNVKSSVDKFYSQEVLQQMKEAFSAKPGDLILILSSYANFVWKWDVSWDCVIRINLLVCGLLIFRCLSGVKKKVV